MAELEIDGDVLVAEDDPQISGMVNAVIAREGLRVVRVATGTEALLSLRHCDYSAIVLDLMLPERSGFDVLDCLRKCKPGSLQRVVVMTASPRHVNSLDASELTGVLIKPFDINDLTRMVRTAVHRAKSSH
ncbi:MAG TPA: response regulator [Thermoanaerobaculia bacterium]|nr:response regulator [Thermoanaerobaculia bacterium]